MRPGRMVCHFPSSQWQNLLLLFKWNPPNVTLDFTFSASYGVTALGLGTWSPANTRGPLPPPPQADLGILPPPQVQCPVGDQEEVCHGYLGREVAEVCSWAGQGPQVRGRRLSPSTSASLLPVVQNPGKSPLFVHQAAVILA